MYIAKAFALIRTKISLGYTILFALPEFFFAYYNICFVSYHPGTHDVMCYSVVACESRATEFRPPSILRAELALPVLASCFVTRSQAALHLLGCLDTLTQAQDHRFTVREESDDRQAAVGKVYSREDFAAVTRFESKQCDFY
jgi:E3 ubiquitin-protein ligase MYCBP2